VEIVNSSKAGAEFLRIHSDKFISRISPLYLRNPSPSLDIINTIGRSDALMFSAFNICGELAAKNLACLKRDETEYNRYYPLYLTL
jgi:hypothetical protein